MFSISVVREGSVPNKEDTPVLPIRAVTPGGLLLMPQLLHTSLPLLLVTSWYNQAAWKLCTAAPDFVNLRPDHDF